MGCRTAVPAPAGIRSGPAFPSGVGVVTKIGMDSDPDTDSDSDPEKKGR